MEKFLLKKNLDKIMLELRYIKINEKFYVDLDSFIDLFCFRDKKKLNNLRNFFKKFLNQEEKNIIGDEVYLRFLDYNTPIFNIRFINSNAIFCMAIACRKSIENSNTCNAKSNVPNKKRIDFILDEIENGDLGEIITYKKQQEKQELLIA